MHVSKIIQVTLSYSSDTVKKYCISPELGTPNFKKNHIIAINSNFIQRKTAQINRSMLLLFSRSFQTPLKYTDDTKCTTIVSFPVHFNITRFDVSSRVTVFVYTSLHTTVQLLFHCFFPARERLYHRSVLLKKKKNCFVPSITVLYNAELKTNR